MALRNPIALTAMLNSCARKSEVQTMFTVAASVAVLVITYWTDRLSDKEAIQRAMVFDDDMLRQSVVFARRDLRLIAWMLAAMLIMLGIIADRVH